MANFLVYLRNGALLATLAAAPILVGFFWNVFFGAPQAVTIGTYTALILAWLAALGIVAGLNAHAARAHGARAFQWFYPCPRCKTPLAIIAQRCTRCRTNATFPEPAAPFRQALLLGVGIFYGMFILLAFLLRNSV